MKKQQKLLLFFGLLFWSSITMAQNGKIRGTVIEDSNGEPLFGVTVQLKGTSIGAITDFEGKFEISAAAGTYDLQASFVSFQTVNITGMVVSAGEVTVIEQIRLAEEVGVLEEIVVTAEVIRTTEAALLTVKRKSANLIDGISSASFKKIGDSDAASAVKRVTGVSVEGGKYVYVRGLGDRYTKTMLNSVDIPGLDPDRNSIQIDIFPTNLIDNMVVSKTATADMPADFTGGTVNIETKDFPDEKIFDVSFGISYNPSMHFQSDFLAIEGSNTDWLGFDSDLRDLPQNINDVPGQFGDAQQVLDFNNSFSPVLAGAEETSFMDYSLGITYGDQKAMSNGHTLGYILSANYKSNRVFYDDQEYGEYLTPGQADDNSELITGSTTNGVLASKDVLVGGLAGLAYKTNKSKYRLTALHLQNGQSQVGRFAVVQDPEDGRDAAAFSDFKADNTNTITYTERGLTNLLLNGEHHLNNDAWVIDWRVSPTFSTLSDPDIRRAAFTTEENGSTAGLPQLAPGAAGFPRRIWRELEEVNVVGRLDITRNDKLFGRDAKYKAGVYYTFKERDYIIYELLGRWVGRQPDWETTDPNQILTSENFFPGSGQFNTGYLQDQIHSNPNSNAYNSTVSNLAYYASAEINPLERLKAIVGLRVEDFTQRHTGRDQTAATRIQSEVNGGATLNEGLLRELQGEGFNILEDDKVLDAMDFFPSLNLIYALKDKQNLRFAYSKTIARPSFKELSFAQIIDPVSDRIFNGGLFVYQGSWDGNLTETFIDNFDLRWELFWERGQTISVSAFYKSFEDPIELVRIREGASGKDFQPRNVGEGTLFGGEFEFRTNLDFLSSSLDKFTLNGNLTVTESILDMQVVELEARQDFARPGETIDDTRQMAGMAPYVINAGLGYEDFEKGIDAGLFYNVQGPTLVVVGSGIFPDVETEPFHSLNFNANKSFGVDKGLTLGLSISNLLNDRREEFYESFGSSNQIFTGFSPGVEFGFSLGYKF